jgi:hypothetical protein
MMVLMLVLAFAAGVSAKIYSSTGNLVFLAVAVGLAILCLFAVFGYVVRDRGLL